MKYSFIRPVLFSIFMLLAGSCVFAQQIYSIQSGGRSWHLKRPASSASNLRTAGDCSTSSITLTRQSEIDSFPLTHPDCTVIQDLRIDGKDASPAITRLDSLKYITEVNYLQISNTTLPNLNGLSGLNKVSFILWLDHNGLISNVKPPNIQYLNGLILDSMPAVTGFSGFLNGLLKRRIDYLWVFNDTRITDFSDLQGIDSINHIGCWGLPNFTSFNGLSNLRYCEGIDIWGNGQLTDVSQFSQITRLPYGGLNVGYNYQLGSWNGLQNINYIAGVLSIQGTNFTSLEATGLNPNLVIDNILNPATDAVTITDNGSMSVCNWPPMCNYLQTGKLVTIENNAPGCSLPDVQQTCSITPACNSVTLKTWTGNADNDWDNPANWADNTVPASCDSVMIANTLNQPRLSNDVTIHALTVTDANISMNDHNVTVMGDARFTNASMRSNGCNCEIFKVNNAKSIIITNSQFESQQVQFVNVNDSLVLTDNTFDNDVVISDGSNRSYLNSSGNHYGSLSLTSTTTRQNEFSEIAADNDDWVNGDFTLNIPSGNANGQFRAGNGGPLHIGGNLVINNNIPDHLLLSGIDFISAGNNEVHVTQTGSEPIVIASLSTNKFSNFPNPFASIILDQDVHVSNTIALGLGMIKTSPSSLLVLDANANFISWSSASWIWGPVKKIGLNGNGQQIFPVGDSSWRGETYLNNPGADQPSTAFTVQYFHRNPASDGYDTTQRDPSLKVISGNEYWKFQQDGNTGNFKVVLRYDSLTSQLTNSPNNLRVSRWNGSQWKDNGVAQIGNNGWSLVTPDSSSTDLGVYTLGYTIGLRPQVVLTSVDTAACPGSLVKVKWTADTTMFTGNQWSVYLSDSAGAFQPNGGFFLGRQLSRRSDSLVAAIPFGLPGSSRYRIRVIGTQPADTSINSLPIYVKPFPVAILNVVGPTQVCALTPLKYYLARKDSNAISYNWQVAGGTFVQNNDTIIVTWNNPPFLGANGAINVVAVNSCGNGPNAGKTVTVAYAPPVAPPVLINIGRRLQIPAPPAGQNLVINWFRNGTLINGENGTTYYASQSGNYTATYASTCATGPVSNSISFPTSAIAQTIKFPPISNHFYADAPFALNASSSSGLPVVYTILSGPGSIPGNIYNVNGTGTVVIEASQPGDNTYDTAAPVIQSFVVSPAIQVINFTAIPDVEYDAAPIPLAASAASNLPVTYTLVSGPASISGNSITLTGLGTVTVRASQAGDGNYQAAAPVTQSFCVKVSALSRIIGPASICPNTPVTYSVDAIPGAVYYWRIAGGNTIASTGNTATITWPGPGNYSLLVSASGGCGTASANDTLSVTALSSVAPDSVHSMLPANNSVNLQLPLNLSWVPANPSLFYTYDLYLWKASDAQPSTPFASNINAVNYVLPLSAGLAYNTNYKWMIVAHNGSCTQISTGPVQQFSLIPLPDLQVSNVQAPSSVFSGQTMTVTWEVKNNGPGNTLTNQSWTDAVFVSKDSALNLFNVGTQLEFPVTPLFAATVANPSGLNNGQQYSSTASFTIPVSYSGPLYVYVITNYNPSQLNPVVESAMINDTAHAAAPTSVVLSPQPDMQVDTVFTPATIFSGSSINLVYKVTNHGAAALNGGWTDKMYISKDPLFNIANATELKRANPAGTYYPATDAEINKTGTLLPDSSYTVSVPVVVPNFIYGSYFIYVFTNSTNSIYEGANSSNNVNRSPVMQVFLTATPKLVPVNVAAPSNAAPTQTIAVTWNINNQGASDNYEKNKGHYAVQGSNCSIPGNAYSDSLGFGASYWADKLYISTDSTGFNPANATWIGDLPHGTLNSGLSVTDAPRPCASNLANQNTNPVLAPNASFASSFSYKLPADLPQGNYYLYVYANATKSVYEYPGQAQLARSNKFTVNWADLLVTAVTVPADGASGKPITLSYTVLNSGSGAVFNQYRKDYIYLGNNSSFDASAKLIDSVIYPSGSIPVNIAQSLQKQIVLPNGISGTRYFFVRANADSAFREINFANNINTTGTAINITATPAPNLLVSVISVSSPVYSSTGFPFRYTIYNFGDGIASGNWKDSIFVSCSNSFDRATAYLVATRDQQQYVPNAGTYSDSFQLIVPQTYLMNNLNCAASDTVQVYFFVKPNADGGIYMQTNNNPLVWGQVLLINRAVDHIVPVVGGADTAFVGRNFKTTWSVKNIGLNPGDGTYRTWLDGIWLSPDSVLNGNAYMLGSKTENIPLNAGQSYSDSAVFQIGNIPAGSYYLLVKSNYYDQIPAERNQSNNINTRRNAANQPLKVFVAAPLQADLTDSILSMPATVAAGQPFTVVYRVTNNGQAVNFTNQWDDAVWLSTSLQQGAPLAGRNVTRTLQPGQSYTDSLTVVLPVNYVPGNYILGVGTNVYHSLYESSFSNNNANRFISVYTPAPIDLSVSTIAAADTVVLGKATNVSYRLNNASNNTGTGIETDGIYLSTDSSFDASIDLLMGTRQNQLNILPVNSQAIAASTLITGVTEGSYYLKVKADILNNIPESNKTNNTGLAAKRLFVKVPALPMNTTVADTLTANYLYYKLTVPANLKGQTIMVQLQTPDSVTASNEAYIGLGYVPSAARFDYRFDKPSFGNQRIVIETVVDSVYYIAARGRKANTGFQLATLKAIVLPFSVLGVASNQGGNTGNVTVLLKGTLFRDSMTATLHGVTTNNDITATAVYFINSTSVYASFNLRGAPLGLYDVSLRKPDGSAATLGSSFTVQNTNNGGLITGGAGNSGGTGTGNEPGCDPGAGSGLNSQLQTELVIPKKVFVGWPFQLQINYTNTSNVDIPAQVLTLYSQNGAPVASTEAGLSAGASQLSIEFKNSSLPGNIIPAGSSGTITVYCKAPANATPHEIIYFKLQ